MVLVIDRLEKRDVNTLLFPSFDLLVEASTVTAIHCHVNVREMLVRIFEKAMNPSGGEIIVNGVSLNDRKFTAVSGVCLLNEGTYDRLNVRDHLRFYKDLYQSEISIDEAATLLQLKDKLDCIVGKCTKSEKRRVQFTRILFAAPELAVFEEPLQDTDLETSRIFINLVSHLLSKRKAVLVLTGNMENALTVSERVYRLGENGLIPYEVEKAEEEPLEVDTEENEFPIVEATVQPVRFEKIPAKCNDKIILFSPTEIDFIESGDGGALIMIGGDSYPSDFKMNELEDRLLPYGFFRCHRSYIVNLQRVREVITWTRNSYSLVLDDQSKTNIPLSKTKMAELKEMIGLK